MFGQTTTTNEASKTEAPTAAGATIDKLPFVALKTDFSNWTVYKIRLKTFASSKRLWNVKDNCPLDTEQSQALLVASISDDLLEGAYHSTDSAEPNATEIWQYLLKEINVNTLTAQSVAISSLANFEYEAANMRENKTALLKLGKTISIAFAEDGTPAKSISISKLLVVFSMFNLPAE